MFLYSVISSAMVDHRDMVVLYILLSYFFFVKHVMSVYQSVSIPMIVTLSHVLYYYSETLSMEKSIAMFHTGTSPPKNF